MAESVDALVSNTSGFTSIPVRPRVWVLEGESSENFLLFFILYFFLRKYINAFTSFNVLQMLEYQAI